MRSTNKFRILSFLFFALVFSFPSCEKDYDDDYYFDDGYIEYIFQGHYYDVEKTWRLCNRSWYMEWYDRRGNYYEEVRTFYKEREGIVDYYLNGRPDGREYFRWYWDNLSQTRIYLDYGYNGYSIFSDVRVGTYDLSGLIDGIPSYYEAIP